jgi:hypothetical protein
MTPRIRRSIWFLLLVSWLFCLDCSPVTAETMRAGHRQLVLGTPTGGGKYPFLVVIAWSKEVADPRVSCIIRC